MQSLLRSLQLRSYILVVFTIQTVAMQNCRDPAFVEMSLQDRLYQAEIILYGQDQLSATVCPPEEDMCRTTPRHQRQYSNFMVYCVVKNNGPPVPANITIYPRAYENPCAQSLFRQGVEGWVYLVTLSYEGGKYYWDEINGISALTTIYIVDNDDKLQKAGNVCNLPPATLPEGFWETRYCPSTLNKTRAADSCHLGCQRGWKPIGKSCYYFSDTSKPETRNEAAISCLMKDSNLIAINSQEEEAWLTDVFTNHINTEWWTSGFHNGKKWVWQDGLQDQDIQFTTWRPKEPSGPRGEEDYIVALYQKSKWGWSDTTGNRRLPYVCEKARGDKTLSDLYNCPFINDQTGQCFRAVVRALLNDTFLQSPQLPNPNQCQGKTAYEDINCLRSVRGNVSLVDLLFTRAAYNPFIVRRELDITFATMPGQVSVCGKKYTWRTSHITRPRLGENKIYESWNFNEDTTFRALWDPEPNTLYTLLILDLDLWSVHGAWMNIAGGNLTTGQVVQGYVPLAVATPEVPATFAFLLFKQRSPALLTETTARMLKHSFIRRDEFNLTTISDELGLGDMVGVNILRVSSDAYSSKFFEEKGFTNHCPQYVEEAYNNLRAPPIPLKGTMSLVTNVEFTTEDEVWTMCCQKFDIRATMLKLDPYGVTLESYPTESVRVAPSINITKGNVRLDGLDKQQTFKDEWYTLIMIDGGTVSQRLDSRLTDFPIHWMITNIPDLAISKGETLINYKSPAPDPIDKSESLYIIYLFKQQQKLEQVELDKYTDQDCSTPVRCKLELQRFLDDQGLSLAGVNWFVTSPDTYTIRTLIKDELRSPAEACLTLFPSTRTLGPLVVCDPPKRVAPTVRPVISNSAAPSNPNQILHKTICVTIISLAYSLR